MKVAVFPLIETVPATGVRGAGPAGATMNVDVVTDAASIGLEKVAEIVVELGTSRVVAAGVVAVTTAPRGPDGSSSEHAAAVTVNARASQPRGR